MYNDLLGLKEEIKEEPENLTISLRRSIIDEIYAVHGEVGIEAMLSTMNVLFNRMVQAQIRKNEEEDPEYYEKVKITVIKMAEEARDARNKDQSDNI